TFGALLGQATQASENGLILLHDLYEPGVVEADVTQQPQHDESGLGQLPFEKFLVRLCGEVVENEFEVGNVGAEGGKRFFVRVEQLGEPSGMAPRGGATAASLVEHDRQYDRNGGLL